MTKGKVFSFIYIFFFRYIHRVLYLSTFIVLFLDILNHFYKKKPYKFSKIFKRFSLHDKKFSHIYYFFLYISWDYRDACKYLNFSFFLELCVSCVSLGICGVPMYIILKNVYGLENNINLF